FVIASWISVRSRHPKRRERNRPATLLVALVTAQVALGALTVLSERNVWINSVHVVCGALVLATSLVLTLRTWRIRFAAPVSGLVPRRADDASGGVAGVADVSLGAPNQGAPA